MSVRTMKKALDICPSCGAKSIGYDEIKKYTCLECGFEFYQNTAAAVAGILESGGKVLVVVRNREPGKGLLDFPGGFVDPMESAEEALLREVKEELDGNAENLEYLCSSPNIYQYKDVEYSTCDIFFVGQLKDSDFDIEESEISGYVWKDVAELNPEDFAFISMRKAIELYKIRKSKKK